MKEFLKMENRLIMKLVIEPLSPLIIKLGEGNEEEEKKFEGLEEIKNLITFSTSETARGKLLFKEKQKTKNIQNEVIVDKRKGEIFIPGSTLRGLFRERFNKIYDYKKDADDIETFELKEKNKNHKEVDNLFGWIEGDKAQRGRIFIGDAYLEDQKLRENFYVKNIEEALSEVIIKRNITPIDGFTGKAVVPLKYECTMEKFLTELIVNNVSLEELQNIFFVIRDSVLGEIRIGNSKTRGFGEIKFEIKDMIFENFRDKSEYVLDLKKYFETDSTNSITIGGATLRENLELKEEYKKIDIENPNQFIKTLFGEVR